MPIDAKTLETHRRVQIILWLCMAGAGVMYLVLIKLIPTNDPAPNPSLDTALLVIAVGFAAISFPLENRLRSPREEPRNLARERAGLIVGLVLCEAAALFGVIVHFVTGSPRDQLIVAAGIVGLLLHYPKRED
jgi:hypothetical protein